MATPSTVKSDPSASTSGSSTASTSGGASSSPPTPAAAEAVPIINESSLTPSPFYGKGTESSKDWLTYFLRYVAFKQLSDGAGLALFALLMRGAANTWFTTLPDADRADYNTVITRFRDKYAPAPITMWRRASEFWSRNQRPTESVEEYMSEMLREAHEVSAPDDMAFLVSS